MVLFNLDEHVLEIKFEKGLMRREAIFDFDMVEFGEMDYSVLVTEEGEIGQMIFCNDHLIWSEPDINEIVTNLMEILKK